MNPISEIDELKDANSILIANVNNKNQQPIDRLIQEKKPKFAMLKYGNNKELIFNTESLVTTFKPYLSCIFSILTLYIFLK